MTVIEALILGIIQGLTEFLPVSSSGHLILAEKLMGLDSTNLTFALVTHVATMLALIITMRKQLKESFKKPLCKTNRMVLIATGVTLLVVLVIKNFALSSFDGSLLPYTFAVTAVLLLVTGFIKVSRPMTYFDSVVIGFVQGLAALPGLSRSGSTIASARILGVDAKESTNFSFLISIPIIIGSTLYDFIGGGFAATGFWPLLVGFVTAFFTGLASIKFMLRFLTKRFDVFAIYLIILSIFLFLNNYVLFLF